MFFFWICEIDGRKRKVRQRQKSKMARVRVKLKRWPEWQWFMKHPGMMNAERKFVNFIENTFFKLLLFCIKDQNDGTEIVVKHILGILYPLDELGTPC